jgi:hypothetical protein
VPNVFIIADQLTNATDAAGNVSPTGLADATYPLGPYLSKIPEQPFSEASNIGIVNLSPTFTAAPGAGWLYQSGTGRFWVDHADYSSW